MSNKIKQKGFTLIELIIYIGIAAVILVVILTSGINLMLTNANSRLKQEVYSNTRVLTNIIGIEMRSADSAIVTGAAPYNILTLDHPGTENDITIDTYQKIVTIGGHQETIYKIKREDGVGNIEDLTSDKVNVTNFTLTDMSRGSEPDNINLEITLEAANPGGDPNFDAEIDIETAISIRR